MRLTRVVSLFMVVLLAGLGALARSDQAGVVKEQALDAPNKVKIRVRMEGPYTADVPLQVVCYFKYTPEGAKKLTGAPVELDKRLGGVIGSLRRLQAPGARRRHHSVVCPQRAARRKGRGLLRGLRHR